MYFINAEGKEALLAQQINRVIDDIDSRLNDLEDKASKVGKKPDVSRAEKMGLLHELGVLDFLLQKDISQKKIASLLSLIINGSEVNIEKDLSSRNADNSTFRIVGVYTFIVSKFAELNISHLEEQAQKTLIDIQKRKDV